MKKSRFGALLAGMLLTISSAIAAPAYRLAQTIPLGGGVKWDYLYFDPVTHHIYVSHGSELTVVDPASGKVVGQVTGLQGSHGIAVNPATGLGYADSAKTETISIFDVKSLHVVKQIPALEDADGMAYDPASNQVFDAGGDANAVLGIDAATNQETKIPLGGAPEFLSVDGQGDLFIAINDKNQLVKLGTKTDKIIARWDLPGCEGPTGVAVDPKTRRVFVSCENQKLAVADADSGKIIAMLPIGKGSDAIRFDQRTKLLFSSNFDGTLSIIQEQDAQHFVSLAALKTGIGARTMELDPVTGALFLVTADLLSIGPPAPGKHQPTCKFKPNTLRLLVYQPAD